MQLTKKALMGGVAVLASTASILASTMSPASADPTRPFAATGSDTTQDVWNGLTNDFGAPIPSIASYNAFDANTAANPADSFINTKTGGANLLRPSGSGNGRISLSAVWDPSYASHLWPTNATVPLNSQVPLTHEEIDFARSSSSPAAGTGLKALPFARDAVAIALKPAAGLTGVNLTTGEIASMFNGVDAAADKVTFSAQPATSTTVVFVDNGSGPVAVQPKIPQNASGTRSFFLGAIGVSTAQLAPYIPLSNSSASAGGLPENDGTVLTASGDLIPFSAAQWIAQSNGKAVNTTAGLELTSVNGSAPTSGTAPALAPGALFGGTNVSGDYNVIPGTGVGVFNRDVYNIVPTLFLTGTAKQQTLVSILGSAAGVYGSNSKGVIKAFGFGTLSYGTSTANWKDGAWVH